MKSKLIIYSLGLLAGAIILAGCSKIGILKPDQPTETYNQASDNDNTQDGQELPVIDGLTFVSYSNRSVGYSIERPNRWYWRHYIKSQIGSSHPKVEDYFMTSPKALPGLQADVLGQIVIEVSRQELNELTTGLEKFSKTESQVGGLMAIKYEGSKKDSTGQEIKVIEYQISRDKQSFRFIYSQIEGETDNSQIFERMVKSFAFGV
ncbi:MAG: hypothetical protein ACOZAJ_03585 [Patescibacteria group bacterium]